MTELDRLRWIDLYQRYRWLGYVPTKRLQDQRYDHVAWAKLHFAYPTQPVVW